MKNKIIKDIYTGKIDEYHLPKDLYEWTAKKLLKEVNKGFFKEQFTGKGIVYPAEELITFLKINIYEFSGAKTFQNVLDIQALMFDERGFLKPFNEFKKEALKTYDIYNGKEHWLKVEQDLAWKQSSSAKRWYDIQAEKDVLPMLRYQTAGDDRVRSDHQQYDGLIRPVDDGIWNEATPPLDWNCRCIVEQIEATKPSTETRINKLPEIPKLFRSNPGKTGHIFDPNKHPYFKVDKKYKVFKGKNFGLPIPKNL